MENVILISFKGIGIRAFDLVILNLSASKGRGKKNECCKVLNKKYRSAAREYSCMFRHVKGIILLQILSHAFKSIYE